jgi:hypothetical protein
MKKKTLTALFLLLTPACGFKNSGESKFVAEGEATINHKITVDLSLCEGLDQAGKLECIRVLADIAKAANETKEKESDATPPLVPFE